LLSFQAAPLPKIKCWKVTRTIDCIWRSSEIPWLSPLSVIGSLSHQEHVISTPRQTISFGPIWKDFVVGLYKKYSYKFNNFLLKNYNSTIKSTAFTFTPHGSIYTCKEIYLNWNLYVFLLFLYLSTKIKNKKKLLYPLFKNKKSN